MTYKVVRDCCLEGNCIECNAVTPVGEPLRVVHVRALASMDVAAAHARTWAGHNAVVLFDNERFDRRVSAERRVGVPRDTFHG